jgi:hypothetical protein
MHPFTVFALFIMLPLVLQCANCLLTMNMGKCFQQSASFTI